MIFGSDSNKIFEKWKSLGFLHDTKYPEKCAFTFEKLVIVLINDNEVKTYKNIEKVETIIFPILYRLINNRQMSFDTIEIKNLIKDVGIKYDIINGLNCSLSFMDIEAEFCLTYSETYKK
jgi:hypothetical protein